MIAILINIIFSLTLFAKKIANIHTHIHRGEKGNEVLRQLVVRFGEITILIRSYLISNL